MRLKAIPGSLVVAGLLLATACSQNGAVPSGGTSAGAGDAQAFIASVIPADTTSILKKDTKKVEIGSTVDPTNGDTGPHSLQMATYSYGKIKKGDLMYCNFANSAGTAGDGTTVDLISSAPGSKTATFAQSSKIEGCDGAAITYGNIVYATGLTSKDLVEFNQNGKQGKTYTKPIVDPLADGYGPEPPGGKGLYAPYFVFIGDVGSGSLDLYSLGLYGTNTDTQVVTGFAVTTVNGWQTFGPSGLAYDNKSGTLYIADGANNTIVAIEHTPNLLEKDEIVVNKGGKTFTCKHKSATCAKLVYSGSPLNAPYAECLLPNGNLIVADGADNTLIEMTPSGQVLDTESVDTSGTPGIFGLWATGKTDSDTIIYYTDANTNTIQALEP